mmetsp:Transcript_3803/g.5674  ORF Transcript_3803/g.5674 Transcript_3803/m.5674 type:complete len:249 (-) Transcript_3803:81-827(-)
MFCYLLWIVDHFRLLDEHLPCLSFVVSLRQMVDGRKNQLLLEIQQVLLQQQQQQTTAAETNNTTNETTNAAAATENEEQPISESARLRLELNDWACGVAAGTGFGGMHAVMLYGSLLASENGKLGTLYQPSCSDMPALIVSAIHTFFFTILDLILMLLTFYGIQHEQNKKHGRIALIVSVLAHAAAAFSTTANDYQDGCRYSLLFVSLVTAATMAYFGFCVAPSFLSTNQTQRQENGGAWPGDAFHQE